MATPEDFLEAALNLRRAGVLIFETRCWFDNTYESNDGNTYRRVEGCGSYYRWTLGFQPMCPFCGYLIDCSRQFPYTNPDLWPLTLNYTGIQHILTDEEYGMLDRSSYGWVVGSNHD